MPSTDYIKIKAGTVLTCPKCGKELVRAKVDIPSSAVVSSSDFEHVDGSLLVKHSMPLCPDDGEQYIVVKAMAHTAEGWI